MSISPRYSRICDDSLLCGIVRINFYIRISSQKNEAIFEIASACEAGEPVALFAEKNRGRKSRDTVSLICAS
jgi:hypothetical protein